MRDNKGNNELLSFDELKKGLSKDESNKNDDLSELLEKLDEDKGFEIVNEEVLSDENEITEHESVHAEEKNINEDIISSAETKTSSENNTVRRKKYVNDQKFIDITDLYQKPKESLEKAVPDKEEIEFEYEKPEKQLKSFSEIFRGWFKGFFPNKKDKAGEIIRKIIMDISVFTLIGCAIYYGNLMFQKNEAKKQQTVIQGQVIDGEDDDDDADLWADFFAKYPNQKLPEGMMPKYSYLYALNNDLVGWIRIPNSIIDVQVVKSENNKEYLKKDFYGNYSRYGCPFMDYRNDSKYLSKNTIIYGHHMSDGLVFAELSKFKTVDGFKESPIIEFDTLYQKYKYKVYAAFITNSKLSQDNDYVFNYIAPDFQDNENFNEFVKAVDERRLYDTGVDIKETDKLITLSTCSYEFPDAKLVVIGRLVRDGESENVDVDLAVNNENPRYPQIWYDKNGTPNPFADAPKWSLKG